ncbi:MAG: isoprenylcysteine carboxylmethyltransferase family protein [Betaproteobacteria bacterium]|nr:isoprenylcysteine carboxylmethyltransferase family protein [Betaproteobacteria bacterium]
MPDLPALILAVVVLAYWGRVAAMSARIRRRTRTLAGVVPEQGVERFLWLFFVPLVAAWIALPWFAAWRADGTLAVPAAARSGGWLVVRFVAALAAIALLAATIRCWRRMGRHWKMAVTPGERQVLITDGPFARVRHPIYGYQILLMLASLCVVPTAPMLAIALVHAALMVAKARNEERHLHGVHGRDYETYVARTGRFFPRLTS